MMFKTYIKSMLCSILLIFMSTSVFAVKNTFGVLCYHHVVNESILKKENQYYPQTISVQMLVDHFNWLKHNGYTPVSWQQILDAQNGGTPLPDKAVLLTFDDGYESFYSVIYPLLKAYNYPAVYAIVTDWINTPANKKIAYGNLKLDRQAFLSWQQLREMQDSGLIEIASHTDNLHYGIAANPGGSSLPAVIAAQYKDHKYETEAEHRARLKRDFQRSYDILKAKLGVAPRIMIWPYGQFTDESVKIAKQVGYHSHFSLRETKTNTPDDPHVGRLLLDTETSISTIAHYLENKDHATGIQRTVRIKLDDLYDSNPAKQQQNLDKLVERIHQYGITAVYLQAFSDTNGDGKADALYFNNKYLPVRADIFSQVAWALRTRAGVEVYAWMPILAFDFNHTALNGKNNFEVFESIYKDLSFYSKFDGIFFHNDASSTTQQENSDQSLINVTEELTNAVTPYALGGKQRLKTAGTIDDTQIMQTEKQLTADFESLVRHYDTTVIMTTPDSKEIDRIAPQILAKAPENKVVFELQTTDAQTKRMISDDALINWMNNLQKLKIYNFGYSPDNFVLDQPKLQKIRPHFSLSTDVGLK